MPSLNSQRTVLIRNYTRIDVNDSRDAGDKLCGPPSLAFIGNGHLGAGRSRIIYKVAFSACQYSAVSQTSLCVVAITLKVTTPLLKRDRSKSEFSRGTISSCSAVAVRASTIRTYRA